MSVQVSVMRRSALERWLFELAAPRWMVLFFVLTAAGALGVIYGFASATALMAVPFALLTVNLLAAIVVRPRFRADLPLLLFHLALLALVVLMVLARLIYFDATTALGRGAQFDGTLLTEDRGRLHAGDFERLKFSNEGFTAAAYREGIYRATYNRVGWVDQNGLPQLAEVGDDRPLVIGHYRIYTTAFRGFAPVFEWHPADGSMPRHGTVQLGYKGLDTFGQAAEWHLPNTETAWVMLEFLSGEEQSTASPNDTLADSLEHALVMRVGDDRHVLELGGSLQRPGGTLVYRELNSWMGYRIIYDPTEPWIMATVVAGLFSLIWFYWKRIFARLPPEDAA